MEIGTPLEEPSHLGPLDQAGDRRLVEPQVVCQITHPEPSVAEDGDDAELGQREVVVGADSIKDGHDGKRRSHQRFDEILLVDVD